MIGFLGLPGGMEYLVILVVVLLLFGNRLPGLARSLAQGITEFRKGLKGTPEEKKKALPGGEERPAELEDKDGKDGQ